jgi:hypothetical protein
LRQLFIDICLYRNPTNALQLFFLDGVTDHCLAARPVGGASGRH